MLITVMQILDTSVINVALRCYRYVSAPAPSSPPVDFVLDLGPQPSY
jgi:hypothetical protein